MADARCGATTTSQGPVRMPAFSAAISLILCPRMAVCSRSIGVITETAFSRMAFVVSKRPPRPTSTTCQRHAASSAACHAITVNNSKYDQPSVIGSASKSSANAANLPAEITFPSRTILSRAECRSGDVYSIVLAEPSLTGSAARNKASVMIAVDPLALDPAM